MIASKAILPSVFENNTFPHKNINKRVPVTAGQHMRNILIHFFCHVCTFFSSMFSFYSMDSKTLYKLTRSMFFFQNLFCSFIYKISCFLCCPLFYTIKTKVWQTSVFLLLCRGHFSRREEIKKAHLSGSGFRAFPPAPRSGFLPPEALPETATALLRSRESALLWLWSYPHRKGGVLPPPAPSPEEASLFSCPG